MEERSRAPSSSVSNLTPKLPTMDQTIKATVCNFFQILKICLLTGGVQVL